MCIHNTIEGLAKEPVKLIFSNIEEINICIKNTVSSVCHTILKSLIIYFTEYLSEYR